jgi:transcriptional regulator with XRE-family HTH domain
MIMGALTVKAHSFYQQPPAARSRPDRKSVQEARSRAINTHVARKIKQLRVTQGLTQTALGEILGLTFQQVAKYEKGISKAPPDKLWYLAAHFKIEIGYFFEGVEFEVGFPENFEEAEEEDGIKIRQLRLQAANAIQSVDSCKILRSLLGFMRATSE